MSREQLVMRLLSTESFVENQKLTTGHLEDDDWSKLSIASSALSQTEDVYKRQWVNRWTVFCS